MIHCCCFKSEIGSQLAKLMEGMSVFSFVSLADPFFCPFVIYWRQKIEKEEEKEKEGKIKRNVTFQTQNERRKRLLLTIEYILVYKNIIRIYNKSGKPLKWEYNFRTIQVDKKVMSISQTKYKSKQISEKTKTIMQKIGALSSNSQFKIRIKSTHTHKKWLYCIFLFRL